MARKRRTVDLDERAARGTGSWSLNDCTETCATPLWKSWTYSSGAMRGIASWLLLSCMMGNNGH